jgi:hypothetical protein
MVMVLNRLKLRLRQHINPHLLHEQVCGVNDAKIIVFEQVFGIICYNIRNGIISIQGELIAHRNNKNHMGKSKCLGNAREVWHKHYQRQLPLAALIDELAFTFPHVVFIVSVGNQSPMPLIPKPVRVKGEG